LSHLILATNYLAANALRQAGLANVALGFYLRFVWRKLPSEKQLLMGLDRRSAKHCNPGDHWLDHVGGGSLEGFGTRDIGLFELCAKFDSIEIWVDPLPNDQLVLVWLLDLLRPYKDITTKLSLVHTDDKVAIYARESIAKWRLPAFQVTENHLVAASRVWRAYQAETPEACFDLLRRDLSALPSLKPTLLDLLEELPSASTGLGASEMRMLEMISTGYANVNPLFHYRELRQTRVFNEWQYGYLLDGLAFGPRPAIAGLDEELRTIPWDKIGARHKPMLRSRLSLTEFGKAVVAHKEDFSRHNPIDRWWGGTHLTNDNLWRWNPVLVKP